MRWAERKAVPIILASLGTLALLMVVIRLREAAALVPLNYNEGWNAYHATQWLVSGTAYPPLGGLVKNNYPPLWFPLVALGGMGTDSLIMGGRLAATTGLIALLAAVGAVGAKLNGKTGAIAAVVTCSLVLASQVSEYIGISDPQMVAQALTAIALLICIRAENVRSKSYQAAIFVAVLAGFVKHNVAALPLALLMVTLMEDFQTIVRNVLVACVAMLVGYLLGVLVGGWEWPLHLMAVRVYSVPRLLDRSTAFVSLNLLGLFFAVVGLRTLAIPHARRVLLLYLMLALPMACVFAGGQGVNVNIFIEVIVPMSLGVSLIFTLPHTIPPAVDAADQRGRPLVPPLLAVTAATVWLLGAAVPRLREVVHARHKPALTTRVKDFQNEIAFLRATPGNAMCEDLTLCYLADKSFILDPFNADQEYRSKRISDAEIEQMLQDSLLTVVQLRAVGVHFGVFASVSRYFEPTRRGLTAQFYERKSATALSGH